MAIKFHPITVGGRAIWTADGYVGNNDPTNLGYGGTTVNSVQTGLYGPVDNIVVGNNIQAKWAATGFLKNFGQAIPTSFSGAGSGGSDSIGGDFQDVSSGLSIPTGFTENVSPTDTSVYNPATENPGGSQAGDQMTADTLSTLQPPSVPVNVSQSSPDVFQVPQDQPVYDQPQNTPTYIAPSMQADPSQYDATTGQWTIPYTADPNTDTTPVVPQGAPNEGWPAVPNLDPTAVVPISEINYDLSNNSPAVQVQPTPDGQWTAPSGTVYNADGTLADQSPAPRIDTGPINVWSTDAEMQQALQNAQGVQGQPSSVGRIPSPTPWQTTVGQQDLQSALGQDQGAQPSAVQLPTPVDPLSVQSYPYLDSPDQQSTAGALPAQVTPLAVTQYNLEPQGAPSEGWPTIDDQPSPIITTPAEFGMMQPSTEPTEPVFTPTENTLPPPRPPANIPIESPVPLPVPRPADATQTVMGPAPADPRFLAGAVPGADNTINPPPNFGMFTSKEDIVAWVQQQKPGTYVNTPMGLMQVPQAGQPLMWQGQSYGNMPSAPQVATQVPIPGFARVPTLDTSVAGDMPTSITPLSTTDYPYLDSASAQAVSDSIAPLTPAQEQAATEAANKSAGANFDTGNPPGLMDGNVPLPPSRPFAGTPGEEPEENNPMNVSGSQPYATPNQMAADAGVPQAIAAQAASLIRGGASSATIQRFMADQGYPRSGAWCGEFAGAVVTAAGGQALPYDQAMVASNWMRWGQAVNGLPQPGDIAVAAYQTHGPGRGQPVVVGNAGSHVTIVDHVNNDGTFTSTGGNQGGVRNMPLSRYVFRRSY